MEILINGFIGFLCSMALNIGLQEGMLLHFWYKLIRKLPMYMRKPLGGCIYCFSFWVSFLVSTLLSFGVTNIITILILSVLSGLSTVGFVVVYYSFSSSEDEDIDIEINGNVIRTTSGSVGYDVINTVDTPILIKAKERVMIPTDIKLNMPSGVEAQIRSRSGLAARQGIIVLNSPATIDSDYKGYLNVILHNTSDSNYTIAPGDRIAQIVFNKTLLASNDNTSGLYRGEGGIGSTGN